MASISTAASVPARRIGGDYYDFVELRDRAFGIALADVSGKGVAAALIMSVVQASLRIISCEGGVTPPRLVARMNELVTELNPPRTQRSRLRRLQGLHEPTTRRAV